MITMTSISNTIKMAPIPMPGPKYNAIIIDKQFG